MPANIVEVPARGSTVVAPSSGDPVTDASITQGEQPLADRIAHLEGYEIPSGTRVLIQEYAGAGLESIRLYARHTGGGGQLIIERTWNARWTGGQWEVDIAGPAYAWVFGEGGLSQVSATSATTSGGWSDAEWTGPATIITADMANVAPVIQLFYGNLSGAATPLPNSLYSTNIPKAWGVVNVNTGTITVNASFNVDTSTTALDGTTDLRVQLRRSMASSSYAVIATSNGITGYWPVVQARSTAFFDLRLVDDTGAAVDLTSAGSRDFHFVVFGDQ